jgi:hypothetical protein
MTAAAQTPDKRTTLVIFLVICAAGAALNLWTMIGNAAGWGLDFNQFYSASHLAGTGHLYDWDALRKLEAQHGMAIPTGRVPVVSFGVKSVTWLPYASAQAVWLVASLAALIVFAAVWPGANRMVMAAAVLSSMPVGLLLLYGQDTPYWLMFFALGLWLLQKDRPWLAGVAFAFCICKFHLAVGIPLLLIFQKRWSALCSGAATAAALIAACFLIEGPDWPSRYLAMVSNPNFSVAHGRMPNLHGLSVWAPHAAAFEIAGALALAALLWMLCRRVPDPGVAGAVAAAAGLLLGRHGYANDMALLIPIVVLTLQGKVPVWLKTWAIVLLSPLPTLVLASSRPYIGQILTIGFVVCAMQSAGRATEEATIPFQAAAVATQP